MRDGDGARCRLRVSPRGAAESRPNFSQVRLNQLQQLTAGGYFADFFYSGKMESCSMQICMYGKSAAMCCVRFVDFDQSSGSGRAHLQLFGEETLLN